MSNQPVQINYEVHCRINNTRLLEKTFRNQSTAISYSTERIAKSKNDFTSGEKLEAVKVLRCAKTSDGKTRKKLVFSESLSFGNKKPFEIRAVDDVPVCKKLADFYEIPARQTIGRLFRSYLDFLCITPTELLFSTGLLYQTFRTDQLLHHALSRVATLQARQLRVNFSERYDLLKKLAMELPEKAMMVDAMESMHDILQIKGLDALIENVDKEQSGKTRDFVIRGTLTLALTNVGDWADKTAVLVDLFTDDISTEGCSIIDELMAEILMSSEAVSDVLGAQSNLYMAIHTLALLVQGRYTKQKIETETIRKIAPLFATHNLELSQQAIYSHIRKMLLQLDPLTSGGPAKDEECLTDLINILIGEKGIAGGPIVAEALFQRARIVFSKTTYAGGVNDTLGALSGCFNSQLERLACLMYVADSETGRKYNNIFGEHIKVAAENTISDPGVMRDEADRNRALGLIDSCIAFLNTSGLSDDWQDTITNSLSQLSEILAGNKKAVAGKPDTNRPVVTNTATPEKDTDMANTNFAHKEFPAGEFIFFEGDEGDNAYLIASGEVEIIIKQGENNNFRTLATLSRGDVFGEMAIVDDSVRSASARTIVDTKLVVIPRTAIKSWLDSLKLSNPVVRRLMDVLVLRLREVIHSGFDEDSPE